MKASVRFADLFYGCASPALRAAGAGRRHLDAGRDRRLVRGDGLERRRATDLDRQRRHLRRPTATITTTADVCGNLSLGSTAGSGSIQMTGGSLSIGGATGTGYLYVGYSGTSSSVSPAEPPRSIMSCRSVAIRAATEATASAAADNWPSPSASTSATPPREVSPSLAAPTRATVSISATTSPAAGPTASAERPVVRRRRTDRRCRQRRLQPVRRHQFGRRSEHCHFRQFQRRLQPHGRLSEHRRRDRRRSRHGNLHPVRRNQHHAFPRSWHGHRRVRNLQPQRRPARLHSLKRRLRHRGLQFRRRHAPGQRLVDHHPAHDPDRQRRQRDRRYRRTIP